MIVDHDSSHKEDWKTGRDRFNRMGPFRLVERDQHDDRPLPPRMLSELASITESLRRYDTLYRVHGYYDENLALEIGLFVYHANRWWCGLETSYFDDGIDATS